MSREPFLEVLIEDNHVDSGEILVRSPAVGVYSNAPRAGEILVGGSKAGRLATLGRPMDLVVPPGVSGRVAERMFVNRRDPVEYGQVLLRLAPIESTAFEESAAHSTPAAVSGLPEGSFAVTSPTHGMFYRRPAPDAPYYVNVGQVVEEGFPLALVEVMKCFSAIVYGGPGLPPRAEVVEIRAEDASEVQADQVLFVLKPA